MSTFGKIERNGWIILSTLVDRKKDQMKALIGVTNSVRLWVK